MLDSLNFTPREVIVILVAFSMVFVLLRVFRRDTLADKKRQDIEIKRAALIAKRKAQAQEAAKGGAEGKE